MRELINKIILRLARKNVHVNQMAVNNSSYTQVHCGKIAASEFIAFPKCTTCWGHEGKHSLNTIQSTEKTDSSSDGHAGSRQK